MIPLITGLTLHVRWAKIHFFAIFVGVNLTFFPQHFLGLAGIPRRYSDYPDSYIGWNVLRSIGSVISFVRVLYFIVVVWEAFAAQRGYITSLNSNTILEWKSIGPPPIHGFNETGSTWQKIHNQPNLNIPSSI